MNNDFQYEFYILLTTQIFTVAGVLLSYYLNRRNTERALQNEIKMKKHADFIEKQLSSLYGPIYILLRINHSILRLRFDPDKLEYTNLIPPALWHDMRDNIINPNNDEIVRIIRNNIHLIDDPKINECILRFVVHSEVHKRGLDRSLEKKDYLDRYRFPIEFQDLIYQTTDKLKLEYSNLVGKDFENK